MAGSQPFVTDAMRKFSGKVNWKSVVHEYLVLKESNTCHEIPVEKVARAVAYMNVDLSMSGREIAKLFGEKPPWFAQLKHWMSLHPEAQKMFSFLPMRGEQLAIHDAFYLMHARREFQAQG